MIDIEFDRKKSSQKLTNRLVRFDKDVDELILEIAREENTTISSAIRTMVQLGLDVYRSQKERQQ